MLSNEETQAQLIRELQEANEKYDSLFQGAGDSIFIIDAETLLIVDANANASRRLGYSKEELLQLTLLDIEVFCELDSDNNIAWESTFSGTRVYECEHRRKDGTLIPVEVSSRLTRYDQREVLQNFVRDITERKQSEEQRLELTLEKERIQILADFISQASHEFRTPLTIIQTSTYVLGKTADVEQKTRKIEHIETQINNIITLLDSLALMARLDGGGQDFEFVEVDLNEIVHDVCQQTQAALMGRNLSFVLELSNMLLSVQGDPAYLRLALRHIVENAIRHSPSGGAITIRSDRKSGSAVAEIADTGGGISAEALPHIFERFFRADKAATIRGFGLGLPIAQKIINLHHGSIEVESKEAQGSTFRILLPLIEPLQNS